LVDRYLKWDEERILKEARPIIEEAMRSPTMVVDSRSGPVRVHTPHYETTLGGRESRESLTYKKLAEAMAELDALRAKMLNDQIIEEGLDLHDEIMKAERGDFSRTRIILTPPYDVGVDFAKMVEPAPADMTLKETVALLKKYREQLKVSKKRYMAPSVEIFGDESGNIKEGEIGRSEATYHFNSIEGMEKKLRELIAPANYHSLFKVVGNRLVADFSEIEITEENCLPISLAKWQVNREETVKAGRPINHGGTETCACCQLYPGETCEGCPIQEETGTGCKGTFVGAYGEAFVMGHLGRALISNINEERFLEDLIARRGVVETMCK